MLSHQALPLVLLGWVVFFSFKSNVHRPSPTVTNCGFSAPFIGLTAC